MNYRIQTLKLKSKPKVRYPNKYNVFTTIITLSIGTDRPLQTV